MSMENGPWTIYQWFSYWNLHLHPFTGDFVLPCLIPRGSFSHNICSTRPSPLSTSVDPSAAVHLERLNAASPIRNYLETWTCLSDGFVEEFASGINGKITYKWSMFHCQVWLPVLSWTWTATFLKMFGAGIHPAPVCKIVNLFHVALGKSVSHWIHSRHRRGQLCRSYWVVGLFGSSCRQVW